MELKISKRKKNTFRMSENLDRTTKQTKGTTNSETSSQNTTTVKLMIEELLENGQMKMRQCQWIGWKTAIHTRPTILLLMNLKKKRYKRKKINNIITIKEQSEIYNVPAM